MENKKRSPSLKRGSAPPAPGAGGHLSRDGIQEGVCKGCGKKTTWRGRQLHRDSIHWHTRCYQRLYKRKLRGSFTPRERSCKVCGKAFLVLGLGHSRTMCSQACVRARYRESRDRGNKFSRVFPEGVCLGCGGRTFKGRRRKGRRDSIHWHGICYHRLRDRPDPVRQKLIALHREFAKWLADWKKENPA